MEKLITWFQDLEQREQRLVLIGAAVVLLTLFYLLLIEPTANRLNKAKDTYASAQELNVFMKQTQQKVASQKKNKQPMNIELIPKNKLLAFLDNSMRKYKIARQLSSISPGKEQGANLRFDSVNYSHLMQWLSDIHFKNGINLTSITVTPTLQSNSGIVKATMVLE